MASRKMKKLALNRETLRNLQEADLRRVVGGAADPPGLAAYKQAGGGDPFWADQEVVTGPICQPCGSTCTDTGSGGGTFDFGMGGKQQKGF